MSMDFNFFPVTELPRQSALLQALVPDLAALEQTGGVWLTGSLARGDADRWSSVDLHVLWGVDGPESAVPASPSSALRKRIEKTLGEDNVLIEKIDDSDRGGSFRGISLGTPSTGDVLNDLGQAGVLFELSWMLSTNAEGISGPTGPLQPLYISEQLAGRYSRAMNSKRAAIGPPDAEVIERQLGHFWLLLARLPAVVGRQEQMAAHLLLTEMRALLIDLVVSLNGGSRPRTRARINQYLGQAQREAFEKSLGLRRSVQQRMAENCANWIGQAVALVVLYRWYGPQLAKNYSLPYPQAAENTVLALLSAELENWPARITTE